MWTKQEKLDMLAKLHADAARPRPSKELEDLLVNKIWAEIPFHRRAQLLSEGVNLDPVILALRQAEAPQCGKEHVWSNDYGDDWTPEVGTPCDCGKMRWLRPALSSPGSPEPSKE